MSINLNNNNLKMGSMITCNKDHISFQGYPIPIGEVYVILEDRSPAKMTKVSSFLTGTTYRFSDYDLTNCFELVTRATNNKVPSNLLSDNLTPNATYKHKNNGEAYRYNHYDSPSGMYYFETIRTGARSMFDKTWVDTYLEISSFLVPHGAPVLSPGYAFTNANYGSLTKRQGYTSLGEVSIVEPKTIHSTCRSCGQAGSHNVVNHKEYYYCRKCKCEC